MSDVIDRLNAALGGRYAVEGELGEGGMATVYLADDLRHERKVALKVLKPDLAAVVGAERFLTEIKTTANLQHPHILPLFDSGEADGFLFYVMPYIDGETLRERLDRDRQLPVDEALGIATAVAHALHTAHEEGVVHRDIKPGNILLSRGEPLVADFGIALAVGAAGAGRLTETGLSVGTPFYMSPEQATGDQAIGAASDIYALGCVLYEMLVGEPPYLGNTAQAVLGKIIQGVPVSATSVRKSIPRNVDAAIRKALEKMPADRFTDARGFAQALADPGFRHGAEDEAEVVDRVATARYRRLAYAGWGAAALAVAGLLATFLLDGPEAPRPVERFSAPFLPGQEPAYLGSAGYDLSPDGSMLVYRHAPEGEQILMVRRWDDLTATPVRESSGGANPAVSPDGLELAFEQDDEIKVLALAGGPVRTLMGGDVPEWGPDGYVYASTDSGAVRAPARGGAVERLSRLAEGERYHHVHDVLPGGEWALLEVEGEGEDPDRIRALNLASGETHSIVEGERPRYVPSGHLVYEVEGSTMMAAPFDAKRAELLGTPIAVMEADHWSLSDDGKLFYTVPEGFLVTRDLVWVDRSGAETGVGVEWDPGGSNNQGWSISPDGSRFAIRHRADDAWDIWVKSLSGPFSRLTFDEGQDAWPAWHPDGETIAFLSDRGGNADVWSRRADGTGEPELVLDLEEVIQRVEWTPDGRYLLLTIDSGDGDLIAVPVGAQGERVTIATSSFREEGAVVSPDGRWMAYASWETGNEEIYVRPFPDVGSGRWQVSANGGRNPRWAHGGGELFFEGPGPDRALMAADVQSGPSFQSGTPRALFPMSPRFFGRPTVGMVYRVAPDDQRFLLGRAGAVPGEDGEEQPRTVLVNNFFEVLEQMVGR